MIGAVLAKQAARQAFATLSRKDLAGVMRAWAEVTGDPG
jgi:hypothetical protein